MSNSYWQTKRQKEQLECGNTTTVARINTYIQTWMQRCYSDDIPDEITDKLIASGRVPSYKAIAIAILKNDASMQSLGFSGKVSSWYYVLKDSLNKEEKQQMELL